MARRLFLASSVSVLVLLVLGLSRVAVSADDFLRLSGTMFSYRGQPTVLRGVNFGNEPWIYGGTIDQIDVDEADYRQLEQWGANSIRFDLTAQGYAADPGRFYRIMDQHVSWARAHHLWLIPNLHVHPDGCVEDYAKTCPLWSRPALQDAVVAFWREFAQRYAAEPTIAGYDLLNEPQPPAIDQWYAFAQRIQAAIKTVDPNHFAIVEAGADGRFTRKLGDGFAYSVHIYSPLSFTHNDCGGCSYPGPIEGDDWDRARISRARADGDESIQWARDNQVVLWVGEFGSRPSAGYGQYVADMVDVMSTDWQVHWALWTYRSAPGDFGMYTCRGFSCPDHAVVDPVVAAFGGLVRPSGSTAPPPPPRGTAPAATPRAPATSPPPAASPGEGIPPIAAAPSPPAGGEGQPPPSPTKPTTVPGTAPGPTPRAPATSPPPAASPGEGIPPVAAAPSPPAGGEGEPAPSPTEPTTVFGWVSDNWPLAAALGLAIAVAGTRAMTSAVFGRRKR